MEEPSLQDQYDNRVAILVKDIGDSIVKFLDAHERDGHAFTDEYKAKIRELKTASFAILEEMVKMHPVEVLDADDFVPTGGVFCHTNEK